MAAYIKKCRNCNSKSIVSLFGLGKISFTGKFPKYKEKIPNSSEAITSLSVLMSSPSTASSLPLEIKQKK